MLSKFKNILIKSIKNKRLHVFGLFLLFSFLILVLSKLSKTYTETLMLPILYVEVPEEIILTNSDDQSLNVTVTTHGFNLLASYFHKTNVTVDFSDDVKRSDQSFILETNKIVPKIAKGLGDNFQIQEIEPDTMRFAFSTLALKRVPIKLNSNLTYASGYDSLKGVTLIPDSLNVVGSQKDIANIEVVETTKLRLSEVKMNIDTKVGVIAPSQINTIKLSETEVRVLANVEKFTEGILEIPITITNMPSDMQINYFPKTIKVSYDVSLNNYKRITPSDFGVECDFAEFNSSEQSYLTPKLRKSPNLVKRVKLKQNKIEYIIIQ